jgi:hypothetical protein
MSGRSLAARPDGGLLAGHPCGHVAPETALGDGFGRSIEAVRGARVKLVAELQQDRGGNQHRQYQHGESVSHSARICSRPRRSSKLKNGRLAEWTTRPATVSIASKLSVVGGLGRKKSYAVGLEISCPGGVYNWAPEIPSPHTIAAAVPGKCELAHNRRSFFSKPRRLPHAVIDKRWLHGGLRDRPRLKWFRVAPIKKAPIRRQHQNRKHLKSLAPRAGFEPATIRLTVECSTAELPRNEANWVRAGQRITKPPGLAKDEMGRCPAASGGRGKSLRHGDLSAFWAGPAAILGHSHVIGAPIHAAN